MSAGTKSGPDMRALAMDVLMEVSEKGAFCQDVLGGTLAKYQYVGKRDRAFLTRLVEGTLEYRIRLDYIIDCFSKTPTRKLKPFIRELLRMSVYQIIFMDGVPNSAAVNEAVKLSKKRGFGGLSGYVNGVLRSIARCRDEISYPGTDDPVRYLSVMYSVPDWIVTNLLEICGYEKTEEVLKFSFEERPLTIHVNGEKTTPEDLFDRLHSRDIDVSRIEGFPGVLRISGYDYLGAIPEFNDGLFWVQDLGSVLAAEAADVHPGDCCIDVCAAPGGKTFCLHEACGENGIVYSRDISEYKADLIRGGAKRLGASNINISVHDARITDEFLINTADVLLADLPCSGLGVLGRKPDLKYRMTEEQIPKLAALQRDILKTVQAYVKPCGTLIYSTCTVSRAENEENAVWFESHFPFEAEEISFKAKESFLQTPNRGRLQILPGSGGCDGFFIAKFRRKS